MTLGLGIIIGILLSIFLATLNIRYAQPAERLLKQVEAKLKQKGSLLDPEDEALKSWIEKLPNDHPSQE